MIYSFHIFNLFKITNKLQIIFFFKCTRILADKKNIEIKTNLHKLLTIIRPWIFFYPINFSFFLLLSKNLISFPIKFQISLFY